MYKSSWDEHWAQSVKAKAWAIDPDIPMHAIGCIFGILASYVAWKLQDMLKMV